MIITAKLAFNQSNNTLNAPKNWQKKPLRQLRRIERLIHRNSKKGKTSMEYYPSLNNLVLEELKRNGYIIHARTHHWDYEWVDIHWNNPN